MSSAQHGNGAPIQEPPSFVGRAIIPVLALLVLPGILWWSFAALGFTLLLLATLIVATAPGVPYPNAFLEVPFVLGALACLALAVAATGLTTILPWHVLKRRQWAWRYTIGLQILTVVVCVGFLGAAALIEPAFTAGREWVPPLGVIGAINIVVMTGLILPLVRRAFVPADPPTSVSLIGAASVLIVSALVGGTWIYGLLLRSLDAVRMVSATGSLTLSMVNASLTAQAVVLGIFLVWNLLLRKEAFWAWATSLAMLGAGTLLMALVPATQSAPHLSLLAVFPLVGLVLLLLPRSRPRPRQHPEPLPAA